VTAKPEISTELHDESAKAMTKNYVDSPTVASQEDLDEEIESIGEAHDDPDAAIADEELDADDDEGYF
jgi:hypothetical protein